MVIVRTQQEIDDLMNKVSEIKNNIGSKYPGMSYEEGIEAAIKWITGETDENPLEE